MKSFLKKKIDYIKSHPRIDLLFLLIGVAVFVTITLINAPRASIWFDEAFSAYLLQFNYLEIAQFTATDVHPPFYYWVLKAWATLFGTTELALRSLSIVFGTGVVVLSFFLTRQLFGRLSAGIATLFLVLSPMLIRYSDEARMYTLAAFIIMGATYVLLQAIETNKRSKWVVYGLLVGLGMWTHYFTALAWLAHWAWRAITVKKASKPGQFWKKFFTKEWIIAHAIAVGFFIPWLPFMAYQIGVIQGGGFWIGPVSADTIPNFFTNIFYYLEHGDAQGWLALLLIGIVGLLIVLVPKVYKALGRSEKAKYLLVAALTFVPPILLFLTSLPPLRPSFVERYLVPAAIGFAIFAAVTLVIGTRKWRPVLRVLPIIVVAGMMIFGITNVYKYGNYNKNSNTHILTREIVHEAMEKAGPGVPIVANSPWIFYEAVPYETADNPIYFINENTQYIYGSLDMLKNRDLHKIKDLNAFEKQHPTIWYIGVTGAEDVPGYRDSWQKLQSIGIYDPVSNKTDYRATEYRLSGE